ncbi:ABC transporter permease subunit, partial [Bacillus haynesii]
GIGMTAWEQIRLVELPLSVPVIMAGIRTSTVYLIGWATLAAFIGGGGLGDYI